MVDFLDQKRGEIEARLNELRPLVDEFNRLEAAASALAGVGGTEVARPAATHRSGRTRARSGAAKSTRATGAARRGRGRPKGSGTRSKEALALVSSRPGITIPEIAETMGIKQNYLYRVLPQLQKDGLVRKDGRGWHALEAA